MKPLDIIEYRHCKIRIHRDEFAENPFEQWDTEPPLLTVYDGYAKSYGDAPENWYEVLRLLPDSCFERGKRVEFIRGHLQCSIRDFACNAKSNRSYGYGSYYTENAGDFRQQAAEQLESELGRKPEGYRSAIEWMEAAAAILTWGGIPAVFDESRGYCQGDVTLCLAVATPAWAELVGAPAESHEAQLESAIELYGAWAWGDVYGFTCEDESGDEIDDIGASVWGYYGRDHDKSGLLEASQAAIDSFLEDRAEAQALQEQEELKAQAKQAKEAAALESAFAF